LEKTKEAFGWDPEKKFYIPDEVWEHLLESGKRGEELQAAWQDKFEAYKKEFPAEGKQLDQAYKGEQPSGWDADLPVFKPGESLATRQASGKTLASIKQHIPWLIGDSADLASSNDMSVNGEESFQSGSYQNTNI
jgi:transketolase